MQPLTVIGHSDLISNFRGDLRYLTVPEANAQVTMAGLKSLRPILVVASLCPYDYHSGSDRPLTPAETWQQWIHFRTIIALSPSFRLIEQPTELQLSDTEQIQLLLHLEGAHPISEPKDLDQFIALGGRMIALTWNDQNQYAGGALSDGELTPLGQELLKEMTRQNVILDVSHLNEGSFWAALEVFEGSVLASHSNARELTDSPRNLTKRQLHALRERKAWVGVSFARSHLTDKAHATVDDVMRHLNYLRAELASDLVGLGTDFGGILGSPPEGLATVGDLTNLWPILTEHGWSTEEITRVRGQNFIDFWMRLLK